jgi:hypothetical protein
MVQGDLSSFLHDARHRLDLPLSAKPYDKYGLEDLFEPFFEWAVLHPHSDVDNWESILRQSKETLDAYWEGNQWTDVPDTEIEGFVDSVHQLTSLFECTDCGQLLDYDQKEACYFCATCTEQETIISPVSACWFVR